MFLDSRVLFTGIYIRIYIYIYMYVCIYVCMYVCMYVGMCEYEKTMVCEEPAGKMVRAL